MAKIPVTKTVVRNGQTHVQTYWEEEDKNSSQPSLLAGLGVSLPTQQKKSPAFPQDLELENQWRVIMGDQFDSPDAQAAIAAGLTFHAAQSIISTLPEWSSLSDYIYENNLDEQPRPKGGWQNRDGHPSSDQRRSWEQAGIPLETAVKWIDAGFKNANSGITEIIKAGIPMERAKVWVDHLRLTRPNDYNIMVVWAELNSSMSLKEALQWRKEFNGHDKACLSPREIEFYEKGFTSSVAKRWSNACYEAVTIDQMIALKDLKWSPSSLKNAIKELDRYSNSKLNGDLAKQIIDFTPKVGSPKLVLEWAEAERIMREGDEVFAPEFIEKLHEVERFKDRAAKEYGISLQPASNYDLLQLLPNQRETLLYIMDDTSRFLSTGKESVRETAELARFISSPDNFTLLRENGFPFNDPQTNEPYNISFGSDNYADFDARTADKPARDKWMKELAFRLYSKTVRQQPQRDRWTEDDSIDPVQLKDLLLNDPKADDVRIEALLVANVAQPVAEGWL